MHGREPYSFEPVINQQLLTVGQSRIHYSVHALYIRQVWSLSGKKWEHHLNDAGCGLGPWALGLRALLGPWPFGSTQLTVSTLVLIRLQLRKVMLGAAD